MSAGLKPDSNLYEPPGQHAAQSKTVTNSTSDCVQVLFPLTRQEPASAHYRPEICSFVLPSEAQAAYLTARISVQPAYIQLCAD